MLVEVRRKRPESTWIPSYLFNKSWLAELTEGVRKCNLRIQKILPRRLNPKFQAKILAGNCNQNYYNVLHDGVSIRNTVEFKIAVKKWKFNRNFNQKFNLKFQPKILHEISLKILVWNFCQKGQPEFNLKFQLEIQPKTWNLWRKMRNLTGISTNNSIWNFTRNFSVKFQ